MQASARTATEYSHRPTLSAWRREHYPEKYVMKDARTTCLRLALGEFCTPLDVGFVHPKDIKRKDGKMKIVRVMQPRINPGITSRDEFAAKNAVFERAILFTGWDPDKQKAIRGLWNANAPKGHQPADNHA